MNSCGGELSRKRNGLCGSLEARDPGARPRDSTGPRGQPCRLPAAAGEQAGGRLGRVLVRILDFILGHWEATEGREMFIRSVKSDSL